MREVDKINQILNSKEKHTTDEWIVALLSSMASSLAVIADNLSKEKKE